MSERASGGAPNAEPEAIDFVRFCHRRRRVGWPELYDEMCAVAGRGLYRGYGADELATIGIGLGLFQMPALAGLVAQVVAEDLERRRRSAEAIRVSLAREDELRTLAANPALAPGADCAANPGVVSGADPGVLSGADVVVCDRLVAPASVARASGLSARPEWPNRTEPEPAETSLPDRGSIRVALAAGA